MTDSFLVQACRLSIRGRCLVYTALVRETVKCNPICLPDSLEHFWWLGNTPVGWNGGTRKPPAILPGP